MDNFFDKDENMTDEAFKLCSSIEEAITPFIKEAMKKGHKVREIEGLAKGSVGLVCMRELSYQHREKRKK